MTDSAIDAIAGLAEPGHYAAGDTLVRQGDPGETLIVIVEGRATVDQDGTEIRRLANGDFLGEISLIDGGPRTATVTAETPIEALVIDRAGFDRLMGDHPAVRLGPADGPQRATASAGAGRLRLSVRGGERPPPPSRRRLAAPARPAPSPSTGGRRWHP